MPDMVPASSMVSSSGMPSNLQHQFAQVPGVEKPRSTIEQVWTRKMTFGPDIWHVLKWMKVVPGDTFQCIANLFCRLVAPLKQPIMDNMWLDWVVLYSPKRILWDNYVKQQGEQTNPGDSTDFLTPVVHIPSGTALGNTLFDELGIPPQATAGAAIDIAAYLPRMYSRFWNERVRDQNLINSVPQHTGDGPDPVADYTLLPRFKRIDRFTGMLPFAQKGNPVTLPLGVSAPVVFPGSPYLAGSGVGDVITQYTDSGGTWALQSDPITGQSVLGNSANPGTGGAATANGVFYAPTDAYANLAAATAATINAIRLATVTQQMLELDARGGTRNPEMVHAHYGVIVPDGRVQYVEYLRGGSIPILTHPIAQVGPGSSPLGTLAGFATGHGTISFTNSFVEDGYVMVLISTRADLTYSQGVDPDFFRRHRLDYYFPIMANIGEQPILSQEIYCTGDGHNTDVIGYQEAWSDWRWEVSDLANQFRPNVSPTVGDVWTLSQVFSSRPVLNSAFSEMSTPIGRITGLSDATNAFLVDSSWHNRLTRVIPMFSVPGLRRF